jgi:hypothetical protein
MKTITVQDPLLISRGSKQFEHEFATAGGFPNLVARALCALQLP